jgi:hypothetical protein
VPEKHVLLVKPRVEDIDPLLRTAARLGGADRLNIARNVDVAFEMLFDEKCGDRTSPLLIIVDMPRSRSRVAEFVSRIRTERRTRLVPVVAFCGAKATRRNWLAGVNSCVARSSTSEEYLVRVELIVSYWFRLNEHAPYRDV